MIYVNGDGFAAGSYLNIPFSWSAQDPNQVLRGQTIHPKNNSQLFSTYLSNAFHLPVQNHAFEFNDHEKIIYETSLFVQSNRVNYVVLIWPNFYRGSVTVSGKTYHFTFNQIENESDPLIKQSMQQYMQGFVLKDVQADFTVKLIKLCDLLDSKNAA